MRTLTFLLRRPKGVAIFYLAVTVLAVISIRRIPIEGTPDLELPKINVETTWTGASPEAVCERVTRPIEQSIKGVEGVEEISSRSEFSSSFVEISFNKKTDLDVARMEVTERVASIVEDLPDGIPIPQVRPYRPREFRSRGFMIYSLSGDRGKLELGRIAREDIRPELEKVWGVSGVVVTGVPDEEIVVNLDSGYLESLGLEVTDISAAIDEIRIDRNVGIVRKENGEGPLRLRMIGDGLEDLRKVVVASRGESLVHLGDMAAFRRQPSAERHFIQRYNGRNRISLRIERLPGSNELDVARNVQAAIVDIKEILPPSVFLDLEFDDTETIRDSIRDLLKRGAISLAGILLTLILFHPSFRATFLVLSSISFSVALTITTLYIAGIPINILTLTALAMGFGLLVDGAVVVTEKVAFLKKEGYEPLSAAEEGAGQVRAAIGASILTTIAAFVPLLASQGVLKMYYGPFAFAVASTLAASYFVCMTLVPSMAAKFRGRWEYGRSFDRVLENFFSRLSSHPLVPVLIGSLLVGASVWLFITKVEKGERWGWQRDYKTIYVRIEMDSGTPISMVDGLMQRFEKRLKGNPGVDYFNTYIIGETGILVAHLKEELAETVEAIEIEELMVSEAVSIAGAKRIFAGGISPQGYFRGEHGGGNLFTLELRGYDYTGLKTTAREIGEMFITHPRVKEYDINFHPYEMGGRQQIILTPDRDTLAYYGLPAGAALWPAFYYLGQRDGSRIRIGGEELDLRYEVEGMEHPSLKKILDSPLGRARNSGGILLSDVLNLEEEAVQPTIVRKQGEYVRTLSYSFVGTPQMANRFHNSMKENLTLPTGYRIAPEVSEQPFWLRHRDTDTNIGWYVAVAIVAVFMVVAVTFDSLSTPLLVMIAIPLALVGIAGGYWAGGKLFTPEAYVGAIFLVGIAVNNTILLIDAVRRLQRKGLDIRRAVEGAVRERTRPVLITNITTIIGMLPLALAPSSVSDLWSTLAFTVVVGLAVSTLLVLSVLPSVIIVTTRKS
jgi:HAE1 family hydrophobic/amphiphilic exporter-1